VCADVVLRVMHTFASLPDLQQLSWLCDEEWGALLEPQGFKRCTAAVRGAGAAGCWPDSNRGACEDGGASHGSV
jgi:hypothetical protein